MIAALLLSAALAQPVCPGLAAPDRARLSVAWVSPLGRKVAAGTMLPVVPTAALRAWVAREGADVGRLLQGLGLRRRPETPRRPYKVVVFDVDAGALCRPMAAQEPGVEVEGLPVCAREARGVPGRYDGSGCLLDMKDATYSLPVVEVTWRDAAVDGFCVLPLGRFVDGR